MFTQMVLFALLSIVVAFSLAAAESAILRMSRVRAAELAEEGRSGSIALVTVVGDSAAYLAVLAFLRVVAEATCAVFITVAILGLVDSVGWALTISIVVMALVSFVVVGVSPRSSSPWATPSPRARATATARSRARRSCGTCSTWPATRRSSRRASGR